MFFFRQKEKEAVVMRINMPYFLFYVSSISKCNFVKKDIIATFTPLKSNNPML